MPSSSRTTSSTERRWLAVLGLTMAAGSTFAGCSDSNRETAPSTTTVAARPAPTTTADPALIDPALEDACDLRTADLIDETSGTPAHRVPMMVEALQDARSVALRALADEMSGAAASQVHVQVNQLTRHCVEAGYKIPNGYGDP